MNQSIIFVIAGVCILIVLIIAYYLYFYLPSLSNTNKYKITILGSETVINEDFQQTTMMTDIVTTRPTLMIPKLGYGLTFTWEMYIPNLSGNAHWNNNYNIVKPLFSMNDSPQVGYNPKKAYISVVTKYRDNPFYAQFSQIKITDIKQQKWCKYILIIFGRTIQVWIDGNIIKTEYLPSLPVIYDIQSSFIIGQKNNNFLGKLRNVTIYPYPLTYAELQTI
jgi:hypothetical protein